ncbi:MAG: prenyltransferase [Gammaproteobacteria bacterium]|nr:MAG: prenyltransferase [Gammaproteobacteria bacterium]
MKGLAADLLAIARGPFLLLTPAVLFPAMAASYRFSGQLPVDLALLIFIAALCAHIAVNALNEYQDFASGLDQTTERTPFSGGSGTLPARPQRAVAAKWLFISAFALMVMIGGYLSWRVGVRIFFFGVVGGLIILAYTRVINRMPLLCLVSPGLGFGLLMVNGTAWLLTGHFPASAQVVSWLVFFLVNGLLLLNQLPDIEADRAIGRNHIPVLLGIPGSVSVYGLLLVGAYGSVLLGCLLGVIPMASLLVLATLPLGWQVFKTLRSCEGRRDVMVAGLGKNVVLVLLTPVLLAVGLLLDL